MPVSGNDVKVLIGETNGSEEQESIEYKLNAADVPIADTGGNFVAEDIEEALAELANATPTLTPASYAAAKADHVASPINYNLNSDTWTKFEDFNGEIESTLALVDLPGNKIVIQTDGAGDYVVGFTLNAQFNTAGIFSVAIYKNGTRLDGSIVHGDFSNGQNDFVSGSLMLTMADGDELELYIKSTNANQDPDIESVLLVAHRPAGGTQGPPGPTGATGPTGPQGPAGLLANWLGAYSGATAYAIDDAVEYLGSSYICITATSPGEDPVGTPAKWDLVAQKGDAGSAQSRIDISVHPHNNDAKNTASATYISQARFLWGGSTLLGTPIKIYANTWQDAAGSGQVRVYDVTNSLVIAESASITTTAAGNIVDLGTISNISAGQAVWRIENKGDGANVNNISALSLEF